MSKKYECCHCGKEISEREQDNNFGRCNECANDETYRCYKCGEEVKGKDRDFHVCR